MSCLHPRCYFLLGLSERLRARNPLLDLTWLRRGRKLAAVDLANRMLYQFDMGKIIIPSLSSMPGLVLPKLMVEAGDLHRTMEQKKMARAGSSNEGLATSRATFLPMKRKAKRLGLRVTGPW